MDRIDEIVYCIALAHDETNYSVATTSHYKQMINDYYKLNVNVTAISRSLNKLRKMELLEKVETGNRLTDYWRPEIYNSLDAYLEYVLHRYPEHLTEFFDDITDDELLDLYFMLKSGAVFTLQNNKLNGFPVLMSWVAWFVEGYMVNTPKAIPKKHKTLHKWIKLLKNMRRQTELYNEK